MEVYRGEQTKKGNSEPVLVGANKKNKFYIFGLVIAVVLLLAGLWYFVIYDKPQELDEEEQAVAAVEELNESKITKIFYAAGETFESKANIFADPITEQDAERKSEIGLANISTVPYNSFGSNILGFAVSKGYAVPINESEIWSAKVGEKAQEVFVHESASSSSRIVSTAISRDGNKIAFAISNDLAKNGSLYILDLKTKTVDVALEETTIAPFMWSADGKMVYLGPNLFGADGAPATPSAYNVKDKSVSPLFNSNHPYDFGAYAVSSDGKYSAYVQATVDENKKVPKSFTGYYVGAPYKVMTRIIETGQISEAQEVPGDTPPNSLVFNQSSDKLYWSLDDKLYSAGMSSGAEEEFESQEDSIDVVYAVAGNEALIGTKLADRSYKLSIVDLSLRSSREVLQTNDSTSAVGLYFE